MSEVNELKARWARGEAAVGAWCNTGAPFLAEVMALQGFHYVCLDAQHGLIGFEAEVAGLHGLARTGTTPIVRVPANDGAWIGKMLDAGAEGVIVPMVETAEDAARAVAACRYAPAGNRSFGSLRGALRLGSDPATVNGEIACIVMVETELGVRNVESICATPGLGGVYIGPADLAITLGVEPGLVIQDGPHRDAIDRVRGACIDAGVAVGIQCPDGASARERIDEGFSMVTACIDSTLVRLGSGAELARAGEKPAGVVAGPYS